MVNLRLPWKHWSLHWLVMIGDASYSLYLLHGLILYYAHWFSLQFGALPDWLCEPWRFAMLALSCVLSYATWRFIETPMISLGNQWIKRVRDAPRKVAVTPTSA